MCSQKNEQLDAPRSIVPPVLLQPGLEKLDAPVVVPKDVVFPVPACAKAALDKENMRVPQCIAHRGFKAKFPENTMLAFDEALKVGASALETDVHITKDDVVVLSHDQSLKRCFGSDSRVSESTWHDLQNLRTLAPPHVPMARLRDLLEYLAQPRLEDVWVLLDIKLDNDADDVMRLIASTIAEISPLPGKPWKARVVLGIWAVKYLAPAARYLPGFAAVHIGYEVSYARRFESVPHVGFSIMAAMLMAPGGKKFILDCQQKLERQVIAWPVDDEEKMRWCMRRKVDGVITNDPSLFIKVRRTQSESAREPLFSLSFRSFLEIFWVYILISISVRLFRLKPDSSLIQKMRS